MPPYVFDGLRGERRGELSLLAHWPRDHFSLSAADCLEPNDVCAATLRTFHAVIVGLKAALCERLVGKIAHKGHIVVRDRRRSQFQQQTGLGLPIFFTGVPETVIAHLVQAFRQDMKKEATEELNPRQPFGRPLLRVMVIVP